MRGYKLLNNNMCAIHGNGMQYDFGREYEIEGKLEMGENGFHFCKTIEDTLIWYKTFEDNRLFEVDTLDGVIHEEKHKLISSKITIIREIPLDEIKQYLRDNCNRLRIMSALTIYKNFRMELDRLNVPMEIALVLPSDDSTFLAL